MMMSSTKIKLENLPPELLLIIFSHVPAKDLLSSVIVVSQQFHKLLNNRNWWMARINTNEQNIRLPQLELEDDEFDAAHTYKSIEEEQKRWANWRTEDKKVGMGHVATVDSIRLFQTGEGKQFCLSGSRDRSIKLWDLNNVKNNENKATWITVDKQNAHEGWIWCIDKPIDNKFLSSGWDTKVQQWQIGEAGITKLHTAEMGSVATYVVSDDKNISYCTTFLKTVFILDCREKLSIVNSYVLHSKPVFGLAQNNNYIYSSGEDRRVIMVDKRNTKNFVANVVLSDYANSLSLYHNQLLCGTYFGRISARSVYDLKQLYSFNLLPASGDQGISCVRHVKHTNGSVLAISRKRKFKVFSPGINPSVLAESSVLDCEPIRFDYQHGTLAIGMGDSTVLFWPSSQQ